jgi:type IV secretory pathway VirB3-like protein
MKSRAACPGGATSPVAAFGGPATACAIAGAFIAGFVFFVVENVFVPFVAT